MAGRRAGVPRRPPLILAAIATEVGRRAGLDVHVLSAPTGWYAGLGDGDRLWLVDATMDGSKADPWSLRRHCAHELAFAALLGLSERYEKVGDSHRADRAAAAPQPPPHALK